MLKWLRSIVKRKDSDSWEDSKSTYGEQKEEYKHPETDQEWKDFHDKRWLSLTAEQRKIAVEHLRKTYDPKFFERVRELHQEDPEHWIGPYHFFAGMQVRNVLREVITDDQLPPEFNTWDDGYVQAIEAAAGVRNY